MADSPADTSLLHRLLRNSGQIALARAVAAVVALAAVPVIVARLGVTGYGTWEATLAVASLSEMLLGPARYTLLWKMSAAHGRNDAADMKRLFGMGVTASLMLLAVVGPASWLLGEGLARAIKVPDALLADVSVILPALVALMALRGMSDSAGALLGGAQRTGFVTLIEVTGQLVNYVLVIAAVAGGWGLWSLLLGYSGGLVLTFVCLYAAAWKLLGPLALWPVLPAWGELRPMARYAGLMLGGHAAAALRDQTDKLVLATMASPAWVGYYGIAARLAMLVMEINRFFTAPLMTAVGALAARGDWQAVRRLYGAATTLVAVAAGFVSLVVLALYPWLIVLWLGRPVREVAPLLVLLVAGNLVAVVLTGPGSSVCRGAGRNEIETAALLAGLFVNLGLTILLVWWIGPIGTVIASATAWVVSSALFVVLLRRGLNLPLAAARRGALVIGISLVSAAVVGLSTRLAPVVDSRAEAVLAIAFFGVLALAVYGAQLLLLRIVTIEAACQWSQRFRGALGRSA